jgi:hypothetical protein
MADEMLYTVHVILKTAQEYYVYMTASEVEDLAMAYEIALRDGYAVSCKGLSADRNGKYYRIVVPVAEIKVI